MANPLQNEKELFEQVKNEEITIASGIWNSIYNHIGDDLTAINLLCQYYLDNNQAIPPLEAEKVVAYAADAGNTIYSLILKEKEGVAFPEFEKTTSLHPVIKEMLTHYIGNDTQMITFMVGVYTDLEPARPVPIEVIPKILRQTHSLKAFMEILWEATHKLTKG